MVARLDHLIILFFVSFVFVCGKHSLNESEAYELKANLAKVDSLNDSFIDSDDEFQQNNVRVNASSLYLPDEAGGNVTEAMVINDTLSSKDFNETDGSNSTLNVVPTTPSTNCTICAVREGDRNFRIESIKHQILENLHFHNPPNMTGITLPKAPRFSRLLERSEIQSDSPNYLGYRDHYEYDDSPYGHTERIFTIAKTPPPDLLMNTSYVSYFNLPEETRDSKIKKAVLWYYMKPSKRYYLKSSKQYYQKSSKQKSVKEQNSVVVNISKLTPPGSADDPLRYWKLHPKKARSWHQLDIQRVVQEWVDRPQWNYGLQLTAFDHTEENLVVNPPTNLIVNPPTSAEDEGYEPMIELKTIKRNHRRVRRNAMRCSANSTERRCCRYPLRVNFVDFGWDWVIAPRDYAADYCSGECRFSMQDENSHSYIEQQVSGTTGPCCTPTMLSPLSMLYFDHDHNILFTNLQDMKVERCGCS